MLRFLLRIWRLLRAEIVFGFLIATIFWTGVLGWQTAYAPTDAEKQKCHETAERSGYKSEECKSFWERTTSDPVAFFTFWLAISTIGLGISTVMLWAAGEKQFRHGRRASIIQSRDMQASIAAANRSAAAAERALTEIERPWVFIFDLSRPSFDATENNFFVDCKIVNFGRTPAIIEQARIGFVFGDADALPQSPLIAGDDHSLAASPFLKAGEERLIREYFPLHPTGEINFRVLNEGTADQTLERIPWIDQPRYIDVFFRAIIHYRGPTSPTYETGANWLYLQPWDFMSRGGSEYNYTR